MSHPPLYAATMAALGGFNPETVRPAMSLDGLIAGSYAAVRRRHAQDRARDEHGRFLPKPTESGEEGRTLEETPAAGGDSRFDSGKRHPSSPPTISSAVALARVPAPAAAEEASSEEVG